MFTSKTYHGARDATECSAEIGSASQTAAAQLRSQRSQPQTRTYCGHTVSPAVPESPASPVGSAYSPTDTPTKRIIPSPPPYSPKRLACDRSYYVARQDHQFALPADCPDNRPARPPMPFSAANPPLQPAPEAHRERVRRRAPSPPRPVGRGRRGPYVRPTIPSKDSAFGRPSLPFARARNLFADFVPNIQSPPSPPPMVRTFPGPPQAPRTPSLPLAEIPPSPDIFFRTVSTQQASG